MSARHAFDYVMLQAVPRVDRDERLNVGVILFCPALSFIGCRLHAEAARLRAVAPELDLDAVKQQLDAVQAVCGGAIGAGPIAAMSPSERFHWLSAPRSTVLQPSPAHTGLCDDPNEALEALFRASGAARG